MKKSVLFVLFALISVAGFSQITGWNAKVGMNFSNYTGDLDLNAKVGFKLGGGFEYAFNDTWSLQPSLFLTSKGAKKDGNSINAMYLELPVMAAARFNVADNTNLVVNAGPYFACGIAGKTKFDLGNDTERKVDTFGDDALKRFDAGVTKKFLIREWEQAKAETVTPNCRQKCSGCGVLKYKGGVCCESKN